MTESIPFIDTRSDKENLHNVFFDRSSKIFLLIDKAMKQMS
jgi:hypothetical protein